MAKFNKSMASSAQQDSTLHSVLDSKSLVGTAYSFQNSGRSTLAHTYLLQFPMLIIFDSIIGYIVKAAQKMAREHIKTIEVKRKPLHEWEKYMDAYFPTTVHLEGCTSWYKAGESNHRVVGLWPGSSLHARKTLENPRWEDFEFGYEDENSEGEKGILGWLGDG